MEDFYFVILKKAEQRGLFNTFNAAPIIKKYLKKSPVYKTKPVNWQSIPKLLLSPLIKKKYIRLTEFKQDVINDTPDNWMDLLIAVVSIESEGLLFLFEKKKIRQQTWTNRLTFIFIVVTFLIGLCNLYYSKRALDLSINGSNNNEQRTQKHK